jgi:hypothetical protein
MRCYLLSETGQYIGTMPAMQIGKKSAIHHGVFACQSMIDGWPATKYPYSQTAEPIRKMIQQKCFGHIASIRLFRSSTVRNALQ